WLRWTYRTAADLGEAHAAPTITWAEASISSPRLASSHRSPRRCTRACCRVLGRRLRPHFSFSEYDAQIGRSPDALAIPYFQAAPTSESDARVFDWIRDHFGPNTMILGICSGNKRRLLAIALQALSTCLPLMCWKRSWCCRRKSLP